MSMFCYQCQEAARGIGCTIKGVCGKSPELSDEMDVLIEAIKALAFVHQKARMHNMYDKTLHHLMVRSLFMTVTNVNFDKAAIDRQTELVLKAKCNLYEKLFEAGVIQSSEQLPAAVVSRTIEELKKTIVMDIGQVNKLTDVQSLRDLVLFGIKGMAAYAEHAYNLDYEDDQIYDFMERALIELLVKQMNVDELFDLVLETGRFGVRVMELLDRANTSRYGHPEVTTVQLGVRNNPGILISGHDLRDLEDLLEQTQGTGVDVYTHSEMLPAHYYPFFKKYPNFAGNYGNAWHRQREEFETFHGPILFTTNCIVPPLQNASYRDRIYTTGSAGLEGAIHIPDREPGKRKDFRVIIEHALRCSPPQPIEKGTIIGGFAHEQVMALLDKILKEVQKGNIRKFVVMAGCDGRMASRQYYTEFARMLPADTVILTAGCAKYRYNKLPIGHINGIPRVLDAGQCNDSYSLAYIALKLKEVLGLRDVNELPIVYNIAWYEQKAVIVLLALLSLGVKNIHLGPTLPAFLSPDVKKVLIDKFGLGSIREPEQDMKEMKIYD